MKFSKTQIEDYRLCPRKWAWKTIEKIRFSRPHAELGIQVHKILELWLRDGTPIDLSSHAGEIAMSMIQHLPPPKTPGMTLEGRFDLSMGDMNFVGVKDVEIYRPGEIPIVMDHKTTSDFKWASTANDLSYRDVQAALYAADSMIQFGTDRCSVQWTYARTRGSRKSLPVFATLTKEGITETLGRAADTAREMSEILASTPRAIELPPNPSACDAFGGCEYRDKCKLTPQQKMRAFMNQGEKVNGLLGMLRKRSVNPPEATENVVENNAVTVSPTPVLVPVSPIETPIAAAPASPLLAKRGRPAKATEPAQGFLTTAVPHPITAAAVTSASPTSSTNVNVRPLLSSIGAVFSELGQILQEVSK